MRSLLTSRIRGLQLQVNAKEVVSFKMGLDLACYVQEHMCEFRANGLKGWGFAEVEYRISPY